MELKGDDGKKLVRSKDGGLVLPEVSGATRIIFLLIAADCRFGLFACMSLARSVSNAALKKSNTRSSVQGINSYDMS